MPYYLTKILKIGKYEQVTSTSVPYFYYKTVYCVQFFDHIEWFEDLESAQTHASFLYEKYFFSTEDILEKSVLQIKKYYIKEL